MPNAPAKPVWLTGASGHLGRMLTKALAAEGWTLRLPDIFLFPDPVPVGGVFTRADLNDASRFYAARRGAVRSFISAEYRSSGRSSQVRPRTGSGLQRLQFWRIEAGHPTKAVAAGGFLEKRLEIHG